MKFEDLTNEQIEKAKAYTTHEERLAFLKELVKNILQKKGCRTNLVWQPF